MRQLLSFATLGVLIAACNSDLTPPSEAYDPCLGNTTVDTVFALWPDSLHLVMGAVDNAWLEWVAHGCDSATELPASEIMWIIRDEAVASGSEEPLPTQSRGVSIEPRSPGRTFLLAEVGDRTDSISVSVPDTVTMGASSWIAAGTDGSCAVSDSGEVHCWGSGLYGTLGSPVSDPAVGTCWGSPCSPMPVSRMSGAASVYVGTTHICALEPSGTAWCWGDNQNRQLGHDGPTLSPDPRQVGGGLTFAQLTAGGGHTCGLTGMGEAYCWGSHYGGRLGGDQRNGPVATPVLASENLRFSSIDAGDDGTCATGLSGGIYCWGLFTLGEAPTGSETCDVSAGKGTATVPCSFVPLSMDVGPASGRSPTFVQMRGRCALSDQGAVFCRDDARWTFLEKVGFGPFVGLTAGQDHACGLTSDGMAQCWGGNSSGEVGDGTTQSRSEPVPVYGSHEFTRIAAGGAHTCGLTVEGDVWCWGRNDSGQAGVAVLLQPTSPARVRGQG